MSGNHALLLAMILCLSAGLFRSLGLTWPKSFLVAAAAIAFALAAGAITLFYAP